MEPIDCETCDGAGQIENWSAYKTCPDCEGMGWVWDDVLGDDFDEE